MVNWCCVCMHNSHRKKDLGYFTFPKDLERRLRWIQNIGRDDLLDKMRDEKYRAAYRVCASHFEPGLIKTNSRGKTLSRDAVPTLFLLSNDGATSSNVEEDLPQPVPTEDINDLSMKNIAEVVATSNENEYNIVPNKQSEVEFSDVTTQTDPGTEMFEAVIESRNLQTPGNLSENTPRELEAEFHQIKQEIKEESDHELDEKLDLTHQEQFLKFCERYLTKEMTQIVKWQINLQSKDCENLYDLNFMFFALNLYYLGPNAYRFLQGTLCLPSTETLRKLIIPINTKMDPKLLKTLEIKVSKMTIEEKICSICIDSMALKANLFYDIKNDRIVGFHEVDGIQNSIPARYVIVIMVRGILVNWKQPIAYSFLAESKNYPEVREWIDAVIASLLQVGFNIRTLTTDLDSNFLCASKSRSVDVDTTFFVINGHKIYYIFDVPYLLKCVHKNLMTCDFYFDGKIAKFDHLKAFYNVDKDPEFRLAPKLTNVHLNPRNFEKIKVKCAAQLLSHSVAAGIQTLVDLKEMNENAATTAEFVEKINKLFDILNSNTSRAKNTYKKPFSKKDYQTNFLKEMLHFFESVRLINKNTDCDVTHNMKFIKCFQITIKSVLQLFDDLKTQGVKYLLTRRLNQDCVENFFEKLRQTRRNCREPTCKQVKAAFKKILLCNIWKVPEGTNCGDDFGNLLLKTDYLQMINDTTNPSMEYSYTSPLAVGTTDYRKELKERNALHDVAGFLYRKCLQIHSCYDMIQYDKRTEQPLNQVNDSPNSLLTLPPQDFVHFIAALEKTFSSYFKQNVQIKNIGAEIRKAMEKDIFNLPCDCFPIDYLKKLFIRLRIYYTLKENNRLLNNRKDKTLFQVQNL